MDFFKAVKQDHEKVKMIFEKMEKSTRRTRENLYNTLRKELVPHMRGEEEVFYPLLREHDETRDSSFEAFEEHHVARVVLDELGQTDVDSDEWHAKVKVLKDLILHHVKEEEGPIFRKARKVIPREYLEDLGRNWRKIKSQYGEEERRAA